MIAVEKNYLIKRPLETVFGFVTTLLNDPLWIAACTEIVPLTQDTYEVVLKFFGRKMRFNMVIVSHEPCRKYEYATTAGPLSFRGCYLFEPVAEGTAVKWTFQGEPGSFFGLVPRPLLAKALEKQAEGDIKTLKELLEKKPVAG
ncbi:MAG: SRPBCC family protein [Ferruginibacter sp.]|nr:SRPBCC family protein [Cytophagales bacterium]